MDEVKVYLSGGIAGLTWDEANEWRLKVTDKLSQAGIECINPLRGRMFVHADGEEFDPNEIVQRDLRDIRTADLVLVYIPKSDRFSIGTTCEIWHTYYTEHKPIILVSDDSRYLEHPWMRVSITKMFHDMDKALDYIIRRWNDADPEGLPEMWVK